MNAEQEHEMALILDEVRNERYLQDEEWGQSIDDQHTEWEWIALLTRHNGLAVNDGLEKNVGRFRKQMIRVAALSIAAVESFDRKHSKPVEKKAGEFLAGSGF